MFFEKEISLLFFAFSIVTGTASEKLASFKIHTYEPLEALYYFPGSDVEKTEATQINLSAASFSKSFFYPIQKDLIFYRKVNSKWIPYSKCKLKQESLSHFVVIFNKKNSSEKWKQASVIVHESRKTDSCLSILNFSNIQLQGSANRLKFSLNLDEILYIPLQEVTDLSLGLKTKKKQKWIIAHKKKYHPVANKNSVLLLFPPLLKGSGALYSRLLPIDN